MDAPEVLPTGEPTSTPDSEATPVGQHVCMHETRRGSTSAASADGHVRSVADAGDEAAGAPGRQVARRLKSTRRLAASETRPKPVVQHRRCRRRGHALAQVTTGSGAKTVRRRPTDEAQPVGMAVSQPVGVLEMQTTAWNPTSSWRGRWRERSTAGSKLGSAGGEAARNASVGPGGRTLRAGACIVVEAAEAGGFIKVVAVVVVEAVGTADAILGEETDTVAVGV